MPLHCTVFSCNYMNMQKRPFSSIRSTELSSREDCCQRGLAKITIKLSQSESRTPSLSLSLINWDLGSTWVSLVVRFKWLLVNDRATPWAVPSFRPEKMRLLRNVINSLSGVTLWSFSTHRNMYFTSCSLWHHSQMCFRNWLKCLSNNRQLSHSKPHTPHPGSGCF